MFPTVNFVLSHDGHFALGGGVRDGGGGGGAPPPMVSGHSNVSLMSPPPDGHPTKEHMTDGGAGGQHSAAAPRPPIQGPKWWWWWGGGGGGRRTTTGDPGLRVCAGCGDTTSHGPRRRMRGLLNARRASARRRAGPDKPLDGATDVEMRRPLRTGRGAGWSGRESRTPVARRRTQHRGPPPTGEGPRALHTAKRSVMHSARGRHVQREDSPHPQSGLCGQKNGPLPAGGWRVTACDSRVTDGGGQCARAVGG